MIRLRDIAGTFALFVIAGVAHAEVGSLAPHTAEYKVKISVVSGQLNTELRRTADGYVANHVIKPVGMSKLLTRGTMDVTSEFSTGDGVVKPIRFRSIDTIRKDPDVALSFDWTSNEGQRHGRGRIGVVLTGWPFARQRFHPVRADARPPQRRAVGAVHLVRHRQNADCERLGCGHQSHQDQGRQVRSHWYSASERRIVARNDDVVRRRTELPAGGYRAATARAN